MGKVFRDQLAKQPTQSIHERWERTTKIEWVKNELRMANQATLKKWWIEKGNQIEGTPNKKT